MMQRAQARHHHRILQSLLQQHALGRSYSTPPKGLSGGLEKTEAELKMRGNTTRPHIMDNQRGQTMREEGDFDERYRLVAHNTVYPNAATNYISELKKAASGAAFRDRNWTGPPEYKSLDRENMRQRLTDEEINERADEEIAKLRGGMHQYDGLGDANELNGSWEELSFYVENAIPEYHYNYKTPLNKDKSSWMFNEEMPPGKEFPFSTFEQNIRGWRRGRLIDRTALAKLFKYQALQLPVFRQKPTDPFARKSHLIKRISYKNVDELAKFLSPGGQILGRRYTGLRLRAQRKVVKEIKKARFLGLLSFTSNPFFVSLENQPMSISMSYDQRQDHRLLSRQGSVDYLELYMNRLKEDVSTTGSFEWDPPKTVTNPQHSRKNIEKEQKGQMEEQLLKKKELLKKWMLENRMLQKFKTVASKEAVEKLEKIIHTNRAKEVQELEAAEAARKLAEEKKLEDEEAQGRRRRGRAGRR